MTTKQKPVVACPHCGKDVEWDGANKFRPFCSERCKLIDLGQWANEGYRIPAEQPPDEQNSDYSGQA